ncbi:ATP synthase F1 subunit epsilon [Thermoproteota archaeon]
MKPGTYIDLKIVTPEGEALNTKVIFIKLPGVNGELGILPNHSALFTELEPGELRVQQSEDQVRHYFIPDGFARILPESVVILTSYLELGTEIDLARAKDALDRAIERETEQADGMDWNRLRRAMKRSRERLFIHDLCKKKR